MKKKIKYILPCLFLFLTGHSVAQQRKIDSLLILLKSDKTDTTKLIHLYNISDECETIGNYPDGLYYGKQALELADVLINNSKEVAVQQTSKKYKAKTYSNIGIIYDEQGNYQEALKNYFASLKIREEMGDKMGIASSDNNIGLVYAAHGNYPEALKKYFICMKIMEAMGNKQGEAGSDNNIGLVYYNQGNYSEALKHFLASLKIRETMGNKQAIAASYNNIGIVYENQKNYPEALKNYMTSLEISKTMGDKASIGISYNNIGNIYSAQAEQERNVEHRAGKFEQALKNAMASLKIRTEIGDKKGESSSESNIGDIFIKQKKYNAAEGYLIKAKKLSKEIGFKECLKTTYSRIMNLDSATGDFKGAYENHKLFILYRDSLDNEETRKKTIQSQMTYDFEKKEAVADAEHKKELENQQTLADEKSRKQRVVLLLVSCFLLLVLIFAGFIFRSLKVTRKQKGVIEQQKSIVEKQKQEVEQQKNLVEEKQKEIIDSIHYARRIQNSLLPTEKYIDNSINRLKRK